MHFLPSDFHLADGFHHIVVGLAAEFCNLQRAHALMSVLVNVVICLHNVEFCEEEVQNWYLFTREPSSLTSLGLINRFLFDSAKVHAYAGPYRLPYVNPTIIF